MRYNRLDLNLLPALRAILKEKNVTRAGESLHLTQPAMSGILARLREQFDDPLVVQIGRRMELTPLAEELVVPLNDLMVRLNATLEVRPGFHPDTSTRHFTVVASDYACRILMTDVLREMSHLAPHVTVEIRQTTESIMAGLETGEIDLLVFPETAAPASVSSAFLFEDSHRAVVDLHHPDVGDTLDIAQYLSFGHIAFQNQGGQSLFDRWFGDAHGNKRRIEVMTHGFDLLAPMVVGTRRVTTVHTRLARQLAASLPVRMVGLAFEVPGLVETLYWHKHRELDPGNRWLRELILKQAANLAPHAA